MLATTLLKQMMKNRVRKCTHTQPDSCKQCNRFDHPL